MLRLSRCYPRMIIVAASFSATFPLLNAATSASQSLTLQDLSAATAAPSSTTIYVAREILTMDPAKPRAKALAVRDGRFISVGTRAEVEAVAGAGAKVDTTFADKVVMAGFVEQHVHPVLAALTMNTKVISIEDWDAIDGFSAAVRNEKGYIERLKKALADHKDKTTPFVTWGYHHYFHGELSRNRLNQLAPDLPVIVWHRSAHEFFLNDAALRLTGIDEALVKGFSKSAQEQLSLPKGHFYEQGALAILGKVARWITLGGIVSANPYYVTALAGRYAELGIGPERSQNMVPMGDVVKHGGSLSFHSDMPMAPAKPLQLVWAAINRFTAEGPVAGPRHKVSLDVALKAITIDAAYSIQMEQRVGSIEVGKDANLTVLEQSPYEVAPEKVKDIQVWGTMLEGRVQPAPAAPKAAEGAEGRAAIESTADDTEVTQATAEKLAALMNHGHGE